MNGKSSREKKSEKKKKISPNPCRLMPLTCKGKLQILNTSKTCRKSCTINSWLTGRSSEVQGKPQSRLIRLHFCYSWNRCQNHKRMTSAKSRPPSLKLMHSGRDWENTCSFYAGSLWCGGKRNLIKAVHWSPMPVFTDYIHRVTSSFVAPWPDFPLLCLQNRFVWPIFTQTEDLVQ